MGGNTMKRSAFLIRILGVVGMITLLVLIVGQPVGAFPFLYQNTPEPTPRPTVTPAPFLQLNPTEGVAGDRTTVEATGGLWNTGENVILYWDDTGTSLKAASVGGDGTFRTDFDTPVAADLATAGTHIVIAIQGDLRAEATFRLIAPTPTFTPSPTNTRRPTRTPKPTDTNTPVTPSPTASPTTTLTPSPTLRPITPMVTITPIPPTKPPVVTRRPQPTSTNTPVPGTPTSTSVPTATPLPSPTPGPGTPSATPQPTATTVESISDTGGGWGMIFLWGFVLAALLVVFRLLRVRGLPR